MLNWFMDAEERTRVLLITEGTYPYYFGGVSTWCHQLIEGLPEVDFAIYGIVADPWIEPHFALPKNVVEFTRVPLWGVRDVAETRPDLAAGELARVRAATTEASVAAEFVPHFRGFLDALFDDGCDLPRLGETLRRLHRYFLRADFDAAMRSRAVWECFASAARRHFPRAASARGFRDAGYDLEDLTTALQHLRHWLFPLARPLPKAEVAHAAMAGLCSMVAVVAKLEHGSAFFLSEHGIYLRERYLAEAGSTGSLFLKLFSLLFARRMSDLAYAMADQISPCCDYNRRWELRNGATLDQLQTIYYGVDSTVFTPAGKTIGEPPVVVWVARINPLKDVKTLLQAAAVVKRSRPDIEFKLFGSATIEDQQYFADCLVLRSELGIEDTVTFAGHTSKPAEAFNQGDVALLSSISEGFPFTILEAMLCGKPVVATAVGGVPEQVEGCGIVVEPRDPEAMGAAILELMNDPARCEALGKAARRKAEYEFGLRREGDAYASSYARLAKPFPTVHRRSEPVVVSLDAAARHDPWADDDDPAEFGAAGDLSPTGSAMPLELAVARAHRRLPAVAATARLVGGVGIADSVPLKLPGHRSDPLSLPTLASTQDPLVRLGTRVVAARRASDGALVALNQPLTVHAPAPRQPERPNGNGDANQLGRKLPDGRVRPKSPRRARGAGESGGRRGASPVRKSPWSTADTAAIDALLVEVRRRSPRPIDELEIAAVLESLGLTDETAVERFGAPDLFCLAEAAFERARTVGQTAQKPAASGAATSRRSAIREALVDLAHGPLALFPGVVCLFVIAACGLLGGWDQGQVMALSLGFTMSMMVTGGFVHAVSRRGSLYVALGHRAATVRFLRAAVLVAGLGVAGLASVAHAGATALDLFAPVERLTFALAMLGLSAIWLLGAGLTLARAPGWLGAALAAGLAAGVAVDRATAAAVELAGQADAAANAPFALGLLAGFLTAAGVVGYGLRRAFGAPAAVPGAKPGKAAAKPPALPPAGYLLVEAAPYFAYGSLSLVLLFVPHVLGWFGALAAGEERGAAVAMLETGITPALVPVVLAGGFAERTLRLFWARLTAGQRAAPGADPRQFGAGLGGFCRAQRRRYLVALAGMSVVAWALFRVALGAGWLGAWLDRVEPDTLQFVCAVALLACYFFGWGVFNSALANTLARPGIALTAVLAGIGASLVVGVPLSLGLHYTYAAVAFVAGAAVFAAVSARGVEALLRSADYHYYASL